MSKQVKQIVGQTQEYPGTIPWYVYAVRCPVCKRMVTEYGDVSEVDSDGDEHYLCIPCGDKVWKEEN